MQLESWSASCLTQAELSFGWWSVSKHCIFFLQSNPGSVWIEAFSFHGRLWIIIWKLSFIPMKSKGTSVGKWKRIKYMYSTLLDGCICKEFYWDNMKPLPHNFPKSTTIVSGIWTQNIIHTIKRMNCGDVPVQKEQLTG